MLKNAYDETKRDGVYSLVYRNNFIATREPEMDPRHPGFVGDRAALQEANDKINNNNNQNGGGGDGGGSGDDDVTKKLSKELQAKAGALAVQSRKHSKEELSKLAGTAAADWLHWKKPPGTPLGTEMYVNHIEDWLDDNSKKVTFDDLFIEVFCSIDRSFVGFSELGNLYYWENWTMANRPDMYTNKDLLLHFVRHCLVDYRMDEYFFPDRMELDDEYDTSALEAAALDDSFDMVLG